MNTLDVKNIHASHGQLTATHDVNLSLRSGEMVFLVGANGAGKTTLLRSIAGDHKHDAGTIMLSGVDVSLRSAHERARAGLSLVPEGRRLFAQMSVRENLMLGASTLREGPWTIDAIYEAFPNLARLDSAVAGKLSGGEQQAVAIGRALMGNPIAIMLDEVSLGLSPAAVDLAYDALRKIQDMGLAILVVEQNLGRAWRTANSIVVMCEGRVTLTTTADATSTKALAAASFGRRVSEDAA